MKSKIFGSLLLALHLFPSADGKCLVLSKDSLSNDKLEYNNSNFRGHDMVNLEF